MRRGRGAPGLAGIAKKPRDVFGRCSRERPEGGLDMTDDTANRMWPTLRAATRRRPALDISTRKKDRSMHDTTADHPYHHRTEELAP
jgi:hypothetical protein